MLTYRTALSKFDRRVWLFIAAWGLVAFAYFGVIGVLLNLYLLRLGFDVAFIGLLIGSGQLIWGAAAFPSVAIGARIGLRRALTIALLLSALGGMLLLLVEAMPASLQKGWLFLSWGILWLGASLNTVSSLPYLAGITQPEHRNYAFAFRQTSIAVFTILGSLIAGALPGFIASRMDVTTNDPAPYRIALMLVPSCFAIASLLMMTTPAEKFAPQARRQQAGASPLPVKLLLMFSLVAFLQTASEGPLRTFFNIHLNQSFGMQPAQIGFVIAIANFAGVFGTLIAPKLMERRSSASVFTWTIFVLSVLLLFIGISTTAAASIIGYVLAFFTLAVIVTTRAPFSQAVVEEALRPTTSAILTLAVALGWGITAIIGGYVILGAGFGGVFVISAALAFASALLTHIYFIRKRAAFRVQGAMQ